MAEDTPQEKKTEMKNYNFSISTGTILKVVFVLLLVVAVYYLRSILAMIFVAFMLASLIDPVADWFEKHKIPRGLAVLLIFIVFLAIFIGVILLLVPPILEQIREFIRDFGGYWERISSSFEALERWGAEQGFSANFQKSLEAIEANLGKAVSGIFSTVSGIFGGVVTFVVVLVMTFYMVVEENSIKRLLRTVAPDEILPYFAQRLSAVKKKLGDWLRGQMILMFIVGLFAYIGLLILGVEYALVLGVFAGLTEIIPYVGPILGAIPAIFLALADSPLKAFFVVILYFVIQQVENHFLVPKVMQRAIGLNPIISIIALLIGAKLAGFVGILLAIPVTTAASVFIKDFYSKNK
ncbi:MAG: AI-2E family transporter [Patescibacteria group bacterium]|nr:AI-2E family transporter [Patescibacteria group bacterium]